MWAILDDHSHTVYRMFMPKKPLSVTLEENNILWLRGRTSAAGFRSISDTLDRLVTEARTSGRMADASLRSVVGTIDIAPSDPLLQTADAALRDEIDASLQRPVASARSLAKAKSRGRR